MNSLPQFSQRSSITAESRDPTAQAHLTEYGHGRYDMDAVIQLSKSIGTLGGNLMNAA